MFKSFRVTTRSRSFAGLNQQQGSALIIALVFLLAMTLIGTTAMQGTSQQERMAGNYWDRNLAFQAAEAALIVGRQNVDGTAPGAPSATDPWDQGITWWQADTDPTLLPCPPATPCRVTEDLGDIADQPRYVVQNLGASGPVSGSAAFGAVTFPKCQVTSRAEGGTNSAVVILVEVVECVL